MPARAASNDFPDSRRMFWRDNVGSVFTERPFNCNVVIICSRMSLTFGWYESPSLFSLDTPRQGGQPNLPNRGVYEIELRFGGTPYPPTGSGSAHWCDLDELHVIEFEFLPSGSYRDLVVSDSGEWTWGVQGWNVVENNLYQVDLACSPTRENLSQSVYPHNGSYYVRGQIAHCHSTGTCDGSTFGTSAVWGDDPTRQIPANQVSAPTSIGGQGYADWLTSFDPADVSLEGPATATYWPGLPWYANSTQSRRCTSTVYYGSCYWRLVANSSTVRPVLYYEETMELHPFGLSTEWVVRCPSAANASGCLATPYISTYAVSASNGDCSGSALQTRYGTSFSIPNDNVWYYVAARVDDAWVNADCWRFALQGDVGDALEFDYHMQWHY